MMTSSLTHTLHAHDNLRLLILRAQLIGGTKLSGQGKETRNILLSSSYEREAAQTEDAVAYISNYIYQNFI